MKRFIYILPIILFSFSTYARNWQKIYIPEAQCGDGTPYYVFIDYKNNKKLAIEFMGGGACWDYDSCYGKNTRTKLNPIKKWPVFSVVSSGYKIASPVHDHTMIYFPYCTGDVFSGNHLARYKNKTVNHKGYTNVQKSIEYIQSNNFFDFKNLEQLILTGASAGAIGAFVHTQTLERYVSEHTKLRLIADSPGLHFGNTFWDKFSHSLFRDFEDSFSGVGLRIQKGDGLIAKYLPQMCRRLRGWKVGVMQSTYDLVMSRGFGEISPWKHRRQVLGPYGVLEQAKYTDNCEAWVHDSIAHTFLLLPVTTWLRSGGVSAMSFFKNMMQ